MEILTSGIESLDALLGGGLAVGDNIVCTSDDPVVSGLISAAFVDSTSPDSESLRVTARSATSAPDPELLERLILGDRVVAGSRVLVDSFDDLVVSWGVDRAVDFYTRVCPRLFDRGAIALWTASRDVAGTAALDAIGRVAQCVIEVRGGRLRVRKAEGRSAGVQGAVAGVTIDASTVTLRAEHAVGRVSEGIRRLRTARGLTQTQVAALAGVTPAAISQVESGRRGLSLESLLTLAEALGTGLDDLLGVGTRPSPWLARRDRTAVSPTVPLFEDGPGGVGVHFVHLEPGASGRPPYAHKGPELLLAASGLVLIDLGTSAPVLRAGDGAMATDVAVRGWTNIGEASATLFWATLPSSAEADGALA